MLIFTPSTDGTYAVIVFSHGFLLANQYYSDTLEHLASHGFIVVAPQTHQAGGLPIGKPSTSEEAATLRAVLSWIPDGLAGLVNVEPEVEMIGIAGHSRGAKIGWLALQADPTLGYAIASIDPVNGTGDIFTMNEVSALDKGLPVGMPSLIIGSGLGEESAGLFQPACSPSGQNHVQFFESADSPSWHIIASDAGHLDFIDPSPAGCGFACTACVTGTNIENNLQLSMGALAAFFRGQLQGDIAALAFLVDKSSHPANSQVETK
jgi:chlorophyllase